MAGFELIDTTFQPLLSRSIGLIFGVGPLRLYGRSTLGMRGFASRQFN